MARSVKKEHLVHRVLNTSFRRLGLAGGRVLLAVSGGADSMVLLDASASAGERLGMRFQVACVDHGLRPEAADEQASVEQAAVARGLPFHGLRVSLAPGPGLEARARAARYEALEVLRARQGLDAIATAHTASDQAETVLMRVSRGSALAGAAGILERRGRVVRPLLACTREEVRAYAKARGLLFHDDPMNQDPAFLRVRVRQDVLPALEAAAGPGVTERLARFARLAEEDERLLSEQADGALRRLSLGVEPADGVDAVGLRALPRPIRRRVLAKLLEQAGATPIDAVVIELGLEVIGRGGSTALPRGFTLRAEGLRVRVTPGGEQEDAGKKSLTPSALLLDGEFVSFGPGRVRVAWRSVVDDRAPTVQAVRVAAELRSLEVRARRPGDRLRLSSGRSRKLQDALVDARVPRERRDQVAVLSEPDGSIVCVVGIWPTPGRTARAGAVSFIVSEPL